MGLFDFVKAAGAKLGIGGDPKPNVDKLKAELTKHGLKGEDLDVQVEGDTVKVKGKALNQEEKEKMVLALGNVEGVGKVDEAIDVPEQVPQAQFYTVKKGDTLSAIAKEVYGDAKKYNVIFEANNPMLTHPDKIYPGQSLRIPPA
ncbi:MAG TPA: peptidoglycan-binding protein LysM [Candidatus Limnocylindria bacterium]|nr:peptidoglycan-binding protein LysM [Candidatus Limnocylindria bacterium]